MSKAVKLKNNLYLDTRGIVHNKKILNTILFPIGYVYISVNNTNPGTIFGGTWEQIKDTFLLACGDTYANGATGGEATHKLTIDQMPSHTHTHKNPYFMRDTGVFSQWGCHITQVSSGYTAEPKEIILNDTGGNQPHNNMPPYLAVYIWKRVS